MKRSQSLGKLITLARLARKKLEVLSRIEGGQPHLQGYCGIASRYLEVLAAREDVCPEFIVGHFRQYNRITEEYIWHSGHSWVEHDGHIIDITATQFKNAISKVDRDFGKKVYISRNTNPHYFKELCGEEAVKQVRTWYLDTFEHVIAKMDKIVA